MLKEITIIGGGSLGCLIAKNLIEINNEIVVNIVTRNKDEIASRFVSTDRIVVKNYEDDIGKGLPCVITVACDESNIIRKLIDSGEENISRFCVAPYNEKILNDILPYLLRIESSAYFVLTNPVEHIMGYLLNTDLCNRKIYGLGLDLDSRRFQIAIEMLSGVLIENLVSIGTHISPVPLIDTVLDLNNLNLNVNKILLNLNKKNNYKYNHSNLDIYSEFLKLIKQFPKDKDIVLDKKDFLDLVDGLTAILVKSEFLDGKPPVKHPAESVSNVLISFLSGQCVNVSYVENLEIKGGLLRMGNIVPTT